MTARFVLVLFISGLVAGSARGQQGHGAGLRVNYLNTKPGVSYVGSQVCAQCHQAIADSFSQTDMGRSMSLPGSPSQLERVKNPVTVYDKEIDRYFKVFRQGSGIYQSEFALDSSGKMIFDHVEKIAYEVGAGENGFSYLIDRGGFLFQAPLSFYTKTGSWDLSPAHELGFTRPIEEGCIMRHSGRAQPVPNRPGLYRRPPFKELAIGCEDCHGPGELHVEARRRGDPVPPGIDPTVVNPAKLPSRLADNICMFCHEKGDVEVLQPGKTYFDFRPATPLDETLVIFKVPLKAGSTESSPLLNHHFLMLLSKCYGASDGRLSCLSCHDPHHQPSAADGPAYYRKKCLACHSTGSCSLPLSERLASSPPDNCVGCHMPQKSLTQISHSALTDHRIPARPDEPYPAEAFHALDAASPGLIRLTAMAAENDTIPPVTLLKAYAELAAQDPAYTAQFRRLLTQVTAAERNDPQVLSMLARDELAENKPGVESEATEQLTEAIQLGSAWTPDYELLGALLARMGRVKEAASVLEHGIALEPYTPSFYPLLSSCYLVLGNREAAVENLKQGLNLFPEDNAMRDLQRKIESGNH